MKMLKITAVAAAMALPAPTHAEKLDLTTMKCKQLLQTSKENVSVITTWLIGYYTDANEPEIIDVARVKDVTEKLSAFCAQHPNFVIASAAEGMLSK